MVNEKGNCYKVFQSTLLQEERLLSRLSSTTLIKISIHAPTRGATLQSRCYAVPSVISIHAPTRGATPIPQLKQARLKISIHAPTRGATSTPDLRKLDTHQFQSTLLQEERHHLETVSEFSFYFNPRSYKRSDTTGHKRM